MHPDDRTTGRLPRGLPRLVALALLRAAQGLRGRGAPLLSGGAPGWYGSFTPLGPKLPGVAGRLLVREDACVSGSGEYRQEASFSTTEQLCLEAAMHVTAQQHTARRHKVHVDGTVLLLTVHHMHSFSVYNVAHLAVSIFPIIDALMAFEESQGSQPVDISAVLFWQIERSNKFLSTYDWFTKVPRLVGNRGLNTSLLFTEDLKEGLCAKRLLLYHRPILDGKVETHFFTAPAHARALRARALHALWPAAASLAAAPRGRTALLAIRGPPQGYANVEEVTRGVQEFMAANCWNLKVWVVGEGDMSLSKQVGMFADADLSISTHGAHLTNIVWQPPGSAVLIIHKCHVARRLFAREAREVGLRVFKAFPSGCSASTQVNSQDVLDYAEFKAAFKKDVLPVLERAVASLGQPGCSDASRAKEEG